MVEMPFVLIRLLLVDEHQSPERPSHDWKLGTFSPTLLTSVGREGLEVEPIASISNLLKHFSMRNLPLKTPKDRVRRASRLVNMWKFGGVVIGEAVEAPFFSHTLPYSWGLMLSSSSVRI